MISKNNKKTHIFTPPRPLGSGGVKICGFLLFLNIVKIENSDFTTILGYANINVMMFSTNYCSNPTVNVPWGSIGHIQSPWTLSITPVLLSVSGDLIFVPKNRFITILTKFISKSHREVAYLGLESIESWSIRTKYIDFSVIHTQHMYTSYTTIRWLLPPRFNWDPSKKCYFTVFNIKFDLEGSRSRLRHPCAPTHHPGSFEHIKFRIFIPGS